MKFKLVRTYAWNMYIICMIMIPYVNLSAGRPVIQMLPIETFLRATEEIAKLNDAVIFAVVLTKSDYNQFNRIISSHNLLRLIMWKLKRSKTLCTDLTASIRYYREDNFICMDALMTVLTLNMYTQWVKGTWLMEARLKYIRTQANYEYYLGPGQICYNYVLHWWCIIRPCLFFLNYSDSGFHRINDCTVIDQLAKSKNLLYLLPYDSEV